jgi:PAS domain S-box-containing protein
MELFSQASGLSTEEMQHHASYIINAFDKEHRVLFWNDNCAAHFGITTEQALGKKLEEILPWVKTDERLPYIDRALLGQNMEIIRVPFRLKNGFYEQRVYSIKDQQGEVIAALSIVEGMNG